jgi:hypothetical protein
MYKPLRWAIDADMNT